MFAALNLNLLFKNRHALYPWLTIMCLCTFTQFFLTPEQLRIDRQIAISDQWINLISCHFIHLSWPHWLANMAGLSFAMLIFYQYISVKGFLLTTFSSAISISLIFLLFSESFFTYVGLSGVIHALFAFASVTLLKKERGLGLILVGLLLLKLTYESLFGALPLHSMQRFSWSAAHLIGTLTGFILVIVNMSVCARRQKSDKEL